MASAADPPPASTSDTLDMLLTAMRNLNSVDPSAMLTEEQARILKTLEQVHAMGTAVHAAVLGAFTTRQGYSEDGEYSPRSWLMHQADVTRGAAWAHTAWSRRAKAHPKIHQAMAAGDLNESWAKALCDITGKLPPDKVDEADGLLMWTKLHGADFPDLLALAWEMYAKSLPDGGLDPAPADRGVRLATTLDGAGVLHGDLTAECAAMVGAVLDALAKPAGAEDARSKPERYHDGLQEAMKRLLAADLLPDRAGHPVKALIHMTLAELCAMDDGSVLQGEWIAAAAARWAAHRAAASVTGSDGGAWLEGRAAQAVACDAILIPVVTGDIDPAALEDLVRLCAELYRLDHHDPAASPGHTASPGPGAADPETPAGTGHADTASGLDDPAPGLVPAAPVPGGSPAACLLPGGPDREALLEAVRQAIIGKAVDLVSGPGGLASFLRRRQLGARLVGPSLPLDIGHSSTIPAAIRTAVTLRDQHCQWAGRCDQPASACEVHHLVHQADGGKTSVRDCGLYCGHHHQIMIHQLGWTVTMNPDGTTTARSPDGAKVFRSHSPPASPG
ncbi:MAG: DUF222 domain-containing protein [Streptosporangiaceae bacterium]